MLLRAWWVVMLVLSSVACGGTQDEGIGGSPSDAARTAEYRWHECGRLPPRAAVWDARYATDGSILILDEGGQLLGFDAKDARATVLAQDAPPTLGEDWLPATAMVLSRDGGTLALWHAAEVSVYRAASGAPIGRDSGPLEKVASLDISGGDPFDGDGCPIPEMLSPDGKRFVSLGDSTVCLWDIESGELAISIPVGNLDVGGTLPLAFSETGDALRVLADSTLGNFTLDGQLLGSVKLRAYYADYAAGLTRDGRTLMLWYPGEGDGSVLEAIDADTGESRWRRDLEDWIGSLVQNETQVLAGGSVYDPMSGRFEEALVLPDALDLSADGLRALSGDDWVSEVELQSGRRLVSYGGHHEPVYELDVSRDGRYLVTRGTTTLLWKLDDAFADSQLVAGSFAGDWNWHVDLSPSGDSFAVSGAQVQVYERDRVVRLDGPETSFAGAWRFSPDGKLLAGISDADHTTVLDSTTLLPAFALPSAILGAEAEFSPDGALLATSRVDVFDLKTQTLLWSQPHEDDGIEDTVEFSPDGSELISVGFCGCDATRYRALTGEPLGQLPFGSGRPTYSPEGHWVVANGRLVHLPSGSVIDFASTAISAVFTAQGRIITGEGDGSVVLYCRSDE